MKVYELIDTPEKWTQGESARDSSGNRCSSGADIAVSWCLLGGLAFCYPEDSSYLDAYSKLSMSLPLQSKGLASISAWNDAPERTFKEVYDMLVKAGV